MKTRTFTLPQGDVDIITRALRVYAKNSAFSTLKEDALRILAKLEEKAKTKEELLAAFQAEYKSAMENDERLSQPIGRKALCILFNCDDTDLDMIMSDPNLSATPFTDSVVDKYMEMDTDLFDSDDLNDIIDDLGGEAHN